LIREWKDGGHLLAVCGSCRLIVRKKL